MTPKTPLPEGWTTVKLEDLLTTAEIKEVETILKDTPDQEATGKLKAYLGNHKSKLESKGVDSNFLAYAIYAKSKNII